MRVRRAVAVVQVIVRVVMTAAGAVHVARIVVLGVRMIMTVAMRVAVLVRMVMRVVMTVVMSVVVSMVVRMVVRMVMRMRMHGAIGMPVHGTAVDRCLAFAATAYRAHAALLRQPSGQLDVLDPQLITAGHL
jgi:hypothetical protein